MKLTIGTILVALIVPVAAGSSDHGASTLDLMPVPAVMEIGTGVFEVDLDFAVTIEGDGATPRLRGGVERMLRRLSDRSTLFFDNDVFLQLEDRADAAMTISAARAGELALGEDESYRLTVTEGGVELAAATDIGALRGLETFLQLLTLDERGVTLPVIEIKDEPRFPWRGLMIDSSRHFMPSRLSSVPSKGARMDSALAT